MGESEVAKIAKLEANVEQLQKDTAEIKDLKEAVLKLTYIVDEMKREKEAALVAASQPDTEKKEKFSFWNTKAGQLVPICATVIVIAGIVALANESLTEIAKTGANLIPGK